VENYPGFPEGIDGTQLMMNMQKQAERFGARTRFGEVITRVDFTRRPFQVWSADELMEARSVIIAVGASHRHIGLRSEELLERKGVTYCATCDGALPMFRNQPLVVVGGGDSACEEATYLTHFGSKIHLIHRRDTLRASKIMADRVLNHPKIEPVWDSVVEDIFDVKQDKVTGVKIKNLKTGATRDLPCAGVFVAIGHEPSTKIFKGQIEMDDHGYVLCPKGTYTSVPGVFASGDCVDRVYRQAITAAGTGCAAAIDAERWLAAHR
jgi:thioredoxin reductase (NADPH)